MGDHLEPGGVALFIGNWETRDGQTWRDVWTSWLDGTGLDAWVVQRDDQDPAEYAELWAGDAGARSGTPGYEDLYAAWLADFAARGVERIGFGVVALQRPTGPRPPWIDLVDHRGPVADAMGPTVDAGLRLVPGWPSTTTTPCSTSPGRARRTSPRSGTRGPARPTRRSSGYGRAAAWA